MSLFISQGNYSRAALKGMINNPEDRTEAVAALMNSVGGKLHSYYMTTGEYDFLAVFEADNLQDIVAGLMVAGATGGVTNLRTVQALSATEAKASMITAKGVLEKFRPAGGAS